MLVESNFEIKSVVRFRIEKGKEDFDSIRSGRILRLTDLSVAWFFIGGAPLVPCTTLRIFSDNQPTRPVGKEG